MKKRKNNFGLGVMIRWLGGNSESVSAMKAIINKEISEIALNVDHTDEGGGVYLKMADGTRAKLFDAGQSCCESRYMATDDDLLYHVGAILLNAETRDAPNEPDEYGEHEVQFLLITTSRGVITVKSHNEHNGYYGGFAVEAVLLKGD